MIKRTCLALLASSMIATPALARDKTLYLGIEGGLLWAKDVDLESLAQRTERFTGADLEDMVRRAGLTALRRGLDADIVTMADFEAALRETRASVTEEMLADYEQIQKTLKSDAVRPVGGIGFVLPGMLQPRSPKPTVSDEP